MHSASSEFWGYSSSLCVQARLPEDGNDRETAMLGTLVQVELLLSAGATSKENKAGERPEDVTDNVTILELLRNAASATVS